MKFAFVTCVQIGLSCMEALYKAGHRLDLIITLHDDKAVQKSGRIYPDAFAKSNNIPVLKINHINDTEVVAALKSYKIDWLFIIGWSQIAAPHIINAARLGAIGAHPTLLPQGRGRAAISWAIIKGLDVTGVTFFKLDEGVDTGPVLSQLEIPLDDNETATTLYEKVNKVHELLVLKVYSDVSNPGFLTCVQNEGLATYWTGRTPADGEILPEMTLKEADRLVRATTRPYPGAFTIKGKKKIIIWKGFASSVKLNNDACLEIQLADGYYYATIYEFENIIVS